MNYDIELTIRDRETKSIAVTIVPFEDDTIALYMNSTLISEPEEVDALAEKIKKCLIMWQG